MNISIVNPRERLLLSPGRFRVKINVEVSYKEVTPDTKPLRTKIALGLLKTQGVLCENPEDDVRYNLDTQRRLQYLEHDKGDLMFGLADDKATWRMLQTALTPGGRPWT